MTVNGIRPDTTWFAGRTPRASAPFRLFCFPYAGLGTSVFRPWLDAFGSAVDVCPIQLPGRETRHSEPAFARMPPLADAAADAIAKYCDVPFACFGHSMGALVAFEVSRRLADRPGLCRLFVSARRAPHLPEPLSAVSHLPDAAFVDAVQQRYQGIPAAVLAQPDLMELLLPRLRADFQVLETYACDPAPPLPCGISVFQGLSDPTVTRPELDAWQVHTRAGVMVRALAGGHLFLQEQRTSLVGAVATDLGFSVAPAGVAH